MKAKRTKITNTRRGPFSNKEKQQIADFIGNGKSLEELALILNRSVKQITNYCNGLHLDKPAPSLRRTEDEELVIELHSQADWKMLQGECTSVELVYFEVEYISYRKQFKDLTKTETKQLHQLIMLEIKLHRHNNDLMRDKKDIERMEKLLKQLYDQNDGETLNANNPNMMLITQLETQVQACRSSVDARGKQANDFIKQHGDILKSLKSTREQRIKNLDDEGKFIGLLKKLEEESKKRSIAELVGLVDLSVVAERDRLSAMHKFADGVYDQPLLIPQEEDELSVTTGTN